MAKIDKFEQFKQLVMDQLKSKKPVICLDADGEKKEYRGKEAAWFLHGAATTFLMMANAEDVEVTGSAEVPFTGTVQ